MPFYTVRHLTRTRYSTPVRENVTELRMQPRSEDGQRCLSFRLTTQPAARPTSFADHYGNIVHHFDIPAPHRVLAVTAEALVEITPAAALPAALSPAAWRALDAAVRGGEQWDFVNPSQFAQGSPMLDTLRVELGAQRAADPLTTLRRLNSAIFEAFSYAPQSTRVDSPIDEAIAARRGVCQDFAHIMIALVRSMGIPCRYVSGYLYHRREDHDRSSEDATHAWVEAWLPGPGWVGFDPTNNLLTGERHIRVAVGRDYADVPPNRGIFKGQAEERMRVGVRVALADAPPESDESILPEDAPIAGSGEAADDALAMQQQQQQQ